MTESLMKSIVVSPLNIEAVEAFVGGDAGNCITHKGCLVVAARQGPLHVLMGQTIVKDDETFSVNV